MPNAPVRFEVATANGLEDAFTRKQIFDLDIQVKIACPLHHVTHTPVKFKEFRRRYYYKKIHLILTYVVRYSLHHVSYAPVKFEVAIVNGLERYIITRNVTDGRTHARTDGRTYGRQTDCSTKLINHFF